MGIQINGNTNNINAGIGSLSIEDLNELDIIGVATAANFKTGVSDLHSVGLTLSGGQIDVGSNIKLGNAGVITATSFVGSGANLTSIPAGNLTGTVADARISTLTASKLTGALPAISGANLTSIPAGNLTGTVADARISTLTASKLTGALPAISGANLTNLPPSAPVGGASTNQVFFENDKLVEVNYQITSTKNAMSAGPISVSAGIAVTIPSGCSWTIV